MRLILNIAKRYLFGKKSANVINIITGVSILGISIGTAALVLILSVFNGFESLLSGMFNGFNPDLKVIPKEGKVIEIDSSKLFEISQIEGVEAYAKVLEEVALFDYQGSQEFGIIKGVTSNYQDVIELDSFILKGTFKPRMDDVSYGIVGIGLLNKLGINVNDRLNPVTIYVPLRKKKILGAKEYAFYDIYPSGVFSVRSETDLESIICPLDFAEKVLGYDNKISGIEIKTSPNANEAKLREEIQAVFSNTVTIKNRFEQDAVFLKIMNIEKWVSYLIVSFTLLLIAFNLVGCLWMIVLDKRNDIAVLKTLGFDNGDVMKTFFSVGIMVSLIGLLLGFVIALILYFLQVQFGLISVPDSFIISAYPIKLRWLDFIIVTFTVLTMGGLASIFPARKASLIPTKFNHS